MSTNPDILIHDYKTSQKEAYLVMIITKYRWRGMSTSPDKAQTYAKNINSYQPHTKQQLFIIITWIITTTITMIRKNNDKVLPHIIKIITRHIENRFT